MRWALWLASGLSVFALAGSLGGARQNRTFRDIAPTVFKSCSPCHYKNGPSPFPLTNFLEIKRRARQVSAAAHSLKMPPCSVYSDFTEFSTTPIPNDAERIALRQWGLGSTPEADTGERAQVKPFAWRFGKPSELRSFAFRVPKEGAVYRTRNDWETGSKEKHLRAFEILAEPFSTLRFATLSVVVGQRATLIGAWSLGYRAWRLPKDAGVKLPPHSRLVLESLHIPSGKTVAGTAIVALYFAKAAMREPSWSEISAGPPVRGAHEFSQSGNLRVNEDAEVVSLLPDWNRYLEVVSVTARRPGELRVVVSGNWKPTWPGVFNFTSPAPLENGTSLVYRATLRETPAPPPDVMKLRIQTLPRSKPGNIGGPGYDRISLWNWP
jgi:hypothetical protein